MDNIVFVYSKDGQVKVLDIESLKGIEGKILVDDGWEHTATLNSRIFIESLANNKDYDDVIQIIKTLTLKSKIQ